MKFVIVLALTLACTSAATEIGQRNDELPVISGRIVNGHKAALEQFPYQVGLGLAITLETFNWCGASLIGREWVLTAAHCTNGIVGTSVVLGTTDLMLPELIYWVSSDEIIVHSGWNKETGDNDISLIKIPPTNFTDRIQPVELPKIGFNFSYVDEKVVISGWGKTSTDGHLVLALQYAYTNVINNSYCSDFFIPPLPSSMICIATDAVSTCRGDSGGPLVLASNHVQIGVNSFGSPNCTDGIPDVFTPLTSHLDWIQSITGIYYQ